MTKASKSNTIKVTLHVYRDHVDDGNVYENRFETQTSSSSVTLLGEFRSEEHALLFARTVIREIALDQHAECWAGGSTTSITIRTVQGFTLLLREAVYADDRRVMQSEVNPPQPCGSPFTEVDFGNF
jgi:hypothetical protein